VTFSRRLTRLFILSGMLLLISVGDAHAYIDPGTGSFVFQLVVASLLGAAFAVKAFWRNIKGFFSKLLLKRVKSER
jgi:hypothetical protein